MDPSQVQKETENDVHSLEHEEQATSQPVTSPGDTATPPEDTVDATDKAKVSPPNPFKHRSFLKRLWDKFNVYLLLFVLVLVIAIGTMVSLTIKGKKENNKLVSTQELTQEDLKQLANTDVAVGTPSQLLTVQANAVFAGSALVRGDLDVAGSFKLGSDLSLKNLNVSGVSTVSELKVKNLTIDNNVNIQGTLNLKGGLSVPGQGNFNGGLVASSISTGALQLNGSLNLTHHVIAGGTIPAIAKGTAVGGGGTASLSGSDTSGSIAINTGSTPPAGCFATITFTEAFKNTPHVIVTPVGASAGGLDFYVTRTTTDFAICTASPAPSGQSFGFDYFVLG